MNCALCRVEIAAESAINGTMCARCGVYADGKPVAPPPAPPPLTPARETTLVEDVATMLGATPDTTVADEEPKPHHQHHSKKSK